MIGLDTNVLARFYLTGHQADAATVRQQQAARRRLESGQPVQMAKTVLSELYWVMRGAYALGRDQFAAVLDHLLASPQITVEDRLSVEGALAATAAGSTSPMCCITPPAATAAASRVSTTAGSGDAPGSSAWCRQSRCRVDRSARPVAAGSNQDHACD